MYKVTKATIIKDGRPVKVYALNDDTDNLDAFRDEVLARYDAECMSQMSVDLQYKEIR